MGCLDMIMYWWICESIGIIFRDKQLVRKRVIWANHFLLANALFTGEKLDFKELILNLFKLSWKSFAFDCFCLSTMNLSEKSRCCIIFSQVIFQISFFYFLSELAIFFAFRGFFFFCFFFRFLYFYPIFSL